MKQIFSIFLFIGLLGCQRDSNFLKALPQKPGTQGIPGGMPPPERPTAKSSKVFELASAVIGEIAPPVDILWIIDNSGSMQDKQQQVSMNAERFMQNFTRNTKLKWKMGIISTTPGSNPYIGFTSNSLLNNTTPTPVDKFRYAVDSLGTGGADYEETFNPVLANLKKYPDFLSPDPNAYLALVIVTDEDEFSLDGRDLMKVPKFLQLLSQYRSLSKVVTYGVFASTHNCIGGNFYYPGSRWQEFMNLTAGKIYSTCDPNFGQALSGLGADLVQMITTPHPVILLGLDVIASTLKVFYAGRQLRYGFLEDGGEWIYDPVSNVIKITNETILSKTVNQIKVEFEYYP